MAGQHEQGIGTAGASRTLDVLTQHPQVQAGEKRGGEMESGCSWGCSPGIYPTSHLLGNCDAAARIVIKRSLGLRQFYM